MGAKDLYLLQIVQYSAKETEKKPAKWAFFIHYTDKAGNLTGQGEVHELQPSRQGNYKYTQRRALFITPTFRGASTLGLFYKKNLYKIYEELDAGRIRVGMDSMIWVEDRLEALRQRGVVLLGPSFQEMARKAYKSWKIHAEDLRARADSQQPKLTDQEAGTIVKRYYCYPYHHYAAP